MVAAPSLPKPPASPAVSVVIVAYQSGALLAEAIAGLAAQTFRDFEVILVDNASTDGAPQAVAKAHAGLKLIEAGANLGFAAANNLAARTAKGRWLALLNPDATPEPEWLAELLAAAARHPDARCLTSLQLDAADPTRLDGAGDVMTCAGIPFRGGYRRKRPKALDEGEVFSACGAAMLIDRWVFIDLGGFDERFFCYCEDVDLGYRLRLAGERVRLAPKAVVHHVGSATLGVRSDFALFHGSRNRVWTFVKNTPSAMLWWSAPLHAAVTAGLLLLHLRRRDAGPVVRGIRAALNDLTPVLTQRRAIQAARKTPAVEILRAMALDPVAFLGRRIVIRS
ncbi:MAG: glycosyltransferase family 2 protein [Caulobacterales bacterium]|nr:glycosyltransferase family 2 protein [Caulobacterales bacterium]